MARKKLIQIRRDTAADWASANPVLASGEAGLETDTNKLKYGNGALPWNLLPYFTAEGTPPDLTPFATKVELENHKADHGNPHGVTKAQVGLSNVPNIDFTAAVAANTAKISFDSGSKNKLDGIESGAQVNTVTSVASKTGAVNLDKNDVGLGNVNNTSDANKPVSNATQIALNNKQDKLVSGSNIKTVNGNSLVGGGNVDITASVGFGNLTGDPADNIKLNNALGAKAEDANLVSHVNNTSNPHNVTKAQLNLGNVDNTSDANKPISTATQGALNTKLEDITGLVTAGSNVSISGSGTNGSPYVVSSSGGGGGGGDVASVNGKTGTVVLNQDDVGDGTTHKRYSLTEKNKLSGIETGADVTDATNVAAAGATMNTDTNLTGNSYFLDEDAMTSNDATKVPSQQSVKAYVDNNDHWESYTDSSITFVQPKTASQKLHIGTMTDFSPYATLADSKAFFTAQSDAGFFVQAVSGGPSVINTGAFFMATRSRGTLDSPTAVGAGDGLVNLAALAFGSSGDLALTANGKTFFSAVTVRAGTVGATDVAQDVHLGAGVGGNGTFRFNSNDQLSFYGATPQSKPTVTGSRGGNAALASLLTALANLGLITNSSS